MSNKEEKSKCGYDSMGEYHSPDCKYPCSILFPCNSIGKHCQNKDVGHNDCKKCCYCNSSGKVGSLNEPRDCPKCSENCICGDGENCTCWQVKELSQPPTPEEVWKKRFETTEREEWAEEQKDDLWVEVMQDYTITAELGHLAKDQAKHKKEMREHFSKLTKYISSLLSQARQEEREKTRKRIGMLRQWINERPNGSGLLTNEDIKFWLYGEE